MEQRNFKTIVEMAYEMGYCDEIKNVDVTKLHAKMMRGTSKIDRSVRASLYSYNRFVMMTYPTTLTTELSFRNMKRSFAIEKKHKYRHDLSHTKIRGFFIRVELIGDDFWYILCEETKDGIINDKAFEKASAYSYRTQSDVWGYVAFWILALIKMMTKFENKNLTLDDAVKQIWEGKDE
jgi:hypothetical protein